MVFGSVGFNGGVHYWEFKIEVADAGSIFLGVAEKFPQGSVIKTPTHWHGWGFVNYRATLHNGGEAIYGEHFHATDTVLLPLVCTRYRGHFARRSECDLTWTMVCCHSSWMA